MNEENQINYYAIIPATVRYNNLLKPSEKLMYGEITALANKMGYCFANNKYFADLYGVTIHTVSQWISHLEKQGYLYTEEILANYTQANIEKIKVIVYVLVEIALSPRGEKLNKISIICSVVALILVLFVLDIYFTVKKAKIENKGIKFKTEDETFGTANWMNKIELEESFEVGNEDGVVVGKIDNKIITLPNNTRHNKNIAVFGASGSKKSRGFVIPNILNLAEQGSTKEGKSMILTDPKGELYKKTYTFLKSKGYNVKILNLVDMDKSDRWNPFSVIENEIDAQIFSEIVIENTQLDKTKGQDEFWSRTGQNLLKALVLGQIELLKNPEERSMSKIYNTLSTGDIKAIDRYFINIRGPGRMSYNIYAQATDVVKQSVVTGLATRLQIFQTKKVRQITDKSDIDLKLPGKEKCAYFCVTSDMDSTFDFIAGLFFSFLFIKLIRLALYFKVLHN